MAGQHTVRAEDVAEPITIDISQAAASFMSLSQSAAAGGSSSQAQPAQGRSAGGDDAAAALVELEPLAGGASHSVPTEQLGARGDGTHVDIVKDTSGHFFKRIIHSSSSVHKHKRHHKSHHHYPRTSKPNQVTYGLGHSRGAPVVVRVPNSPPTYYGSGSGFDSAPVTRPASRMETSQSQMSAAQAPSLQHTKSALGGASISGSSHHGHQQRPQQQYPLIGLAHANPLSGMMGSANPNRPFIPVTASSSARGYSYSSRPSTAVARDHAGGGDANEEAARIAASLQQQQQPQTISVHADLLTALRDIIREEVRSAHSDAPDSAAQKDSADPSGADTSAGQATNDSSAGSNEETAIGHQRAVDAEKDDDEVVVQDGGVAAERGPEFGLRSSTEKTSVPDEKALVPPELVKRPSSMSTATSLFSHDRSAHDKEEEEGGQLDFLNPWARFRYSMREPLAEFLGTCILIIFGNGINCQVFVAQLYQPDTPRGDYLSVSFGWGIGVAFGVFVSGGISGGHLNPAVTIALAAFRGFPWRKVPMYALAQILGGAMGALLIYGLYSNPIRVIDPGQTETTASLFTAFPAEFLRQPSTRPTAFYNEVLAIAVLLIIVLAIGDAANTPPPDGLAPLTLMWAIVGIGATMGWQTAYCLNVARDLGPRIALTIVGYPADLLWSFNAYYFLWTPVLATITGALVGSFIYDTLVYTGGESPLNRPWRWSGVAWRRHSKKKLPAGISA